MHGSRQADTRGCGRTCQLHIQLRAAAAGERARRERAAARAQLPQIARERARAGRNVPPVGRLQREQLSQKVAHEAAVGGAVDRGEI